MAALAEIQQPEQKKKTLDWDEFRKGVPIKIANSKMPEEEVLKRVHAKLEQALSGDKVSIKLGGVNALNLRNYVNETYKTLKATAFEGEDGMWTVKVRARTEASPPTVTVPVKIPVIDATFANRMKARADAGPISAKDVDGVLDSSQADFVKMAKNWRWSEAEYAQKSYAARAQTKTFLESAQIPLSQYSAENAKELVRDVYLLILQGNASPKFIADAAARIRESAKSIESVSSSLIANKGANSRFAPKAGVSDEDIRQQALSAHIVAAFQGWSPEFMLLLANYETGMTKLSTSHHGKGPLQLTSASIFSEAKNPAMIEVLNKYLPQDAGLGKKMTNLQYVSKNILSNYIAAGETLALKWNYIVTSDPSKEGALVRKAVKQRETELGRSFRISDIGSLPEEARMAAYKRLAFHYNGNPAVQNGYAKSVHAAIANGTYKGAEIEWLAQARKRAPYA